MIRYRMLGGAAIVFGALTIWSGGMVLFGPEAARAAAGRIVPFVLWFNFLSGAAYIAAGAGIILERRFGYALAFALALSLAVILAAFLAAVAYGHEWETRTLWALIVRLGFWVFAVWMIKAKTTRPF